MYVYAATSQLAKAIQRPSKMIVSQQTQKKKWLNIVQTACCTQAQLVALGQSLEGQQGKVWQDARVAYDPQSQWHESLVSVHLWYLNPFPCPVVPSPYYNTLGLYLS